MAFTVKDFADLRRVLVTHPEWRVELRQLVLTDDLLTLPAAMRELAQAQARTEQRVAELAQAQARTEARLEALVARVDELAQKIELLIGEIRALTGEMKWAKDRLGQLLGWRLETRYHDKPSVFFGRWLRSPVAVPFESLREMLEAHLTEDEVEQVMRLDLVVRGHARRIPENPEVWLALEISGAIDPEDVERVQERTALLRKAGLRAVAVVAGEGVIPSATSRLEGLPIVLMLDGRSQGWEQAFAAA
ncbi:MAG: hypothetical protein HY327_11495 [Chloroflexi bacterium]|nr:hypothetical protein [Chloroflexota bacterium]